MAAGYAETRAFVGILSLKNPVSFWRSLTICRTIYGSAGSLPPGGGVSTVNKTAPGGGRKIYLALPPYGLHILLGDMGRFQAQQHLASEELAQHFSTPDFTFSSHLLSPPNPRETCGCVLSNIGHSLTPCGSNFPGQAWHFGHRRKMTNLCASTPSRAILSLQVP